MMSGGWGAWGWKLMGEPLLCEEITRGCYTWRVMVTIMSICGWEEGECYLCVGEEGCL